MNFQELQIYVLDKSNNLGSPLPYTGAENARWQVERDELQRHYDGQPPEAIKDAFPNEEGLVLKYRLKIFQSPTRGPLLKAVDDIWRMFSSSRQSISASNDEFFKWVKSPMWDGMPLIDWTMRVAYAVRVIDPNGYLALLPSGKGMQDQSTRIDVTAQVVGSKSLIAERPDLIAWRTGKSAMYGTPEMIHYLTDEVYATQKSAGDGGKILTLVYAHNIGRLPAIKLGGTTVIEIEDGQPKSRQISDFSYSLALMNKLAVMDSQNDSVTISTCFPIRFIDGEPCGTCNGYGVEQVANSSGVISTQTCHTCNGAKYVFPSSPLLGYFRRPTPPGVTPEERQAMSARKPIEFAGPDISTIQHLSERRDKLKLELDEFLNIQKAQNYAQSGVSKEKDRESMYIQIGRIAQYWFDIMIKGVLEISQAYYEPNENMRGTISVSAPVSFDIKDESDLLDEFVVLYEKAPLIMRYPAFMDYIKKRFSNDEALLRAAGLAVMYAPLSIANEAERRGKPDADIIKATYAMPYLLQIAKDTNGFAKGVGIDKMTDDEILSALEVKIQPDLDAAKTMSASLADGIINGNV